MYGLWVGGQLPPSHSLATPLGTDVLTRDKLYQKGEKYIT